MTRPTVIYFGPDGGPIEQASPKIYLRSLLYSTSKRGQIIESMFIRLRRGESVQTFNIWTYGEERLVRGSGVYVGPEGLSCNHHFLLPTDAGQFAFLPGDYVLQVFASLVGQTSFIKLAELCILLTDQQASALRENNNGIYYDWGPDSQRYIPHVRSQPKTRLDNALFESLFSERIAKVEASAEPPAV